MSLAADDLARRAVSTQGTSGGSPPALEELDDFLTRCGLELGEPEVVASATLPDGARLYVIGATTSNATTAGSELVAVDENCGIVDLSS